MRESENRPCHPVLHDLKPIQLVASRNWGERIGSVHQVRQDYRFKVENSALMSQE